MQHPFPLSIIQRWTQQSENQTLKASVKKCQIFDQEYNILPYFSLLTVFITMSSNSEFLQADKYNKRHEGEMRGKWQDLPDEIILKILSYSEVKDLISCGQLSKRTRSISQDRSLWVITNLEKKIVKTELLEMILLKGCKILNLSNSTIVGHLRRNMITQLRVLDLSHFGWGFPTQRMSTQVYYEENMSKILSSCCSLQNLKMEGLRITSKRGEGNYFLFLFFFFEK